MLDAFLNVQLTQGHNVRMVDDGIHGVQTPRAVYRYHEWWSASEQRHPAGTEGGRRDAETDGGRMERV